jgi:hypothetical protein
MVGRCGSGLNFLLSAPLASATTQVFALWCARRCVLRGARTTAVGPRANRRDCSVRFGVIMCGLSYLACFFLNVLDMRETVRTVPAAFGFAHSAPVCTGQT